MNTLEDTMNTLSPDARNMAKNVLESATEMFARDGNLFPMAFTIKVGSPEPDIFYVGTLDDDTKPAVWNWLAHMRRTNPVVGFITEAWVVIAKDKTMKAWDGIMPRDHPDRVEKALFQLWDKKRLISFVADIKHNPDALTPWEVMYDSHFIKPNCKGVDGYEGAMVEGGTYEEDN